MAFRLTTTTEMSVNDAHQKKNINNKKPDEMSGFLLFQL